MTIYGYMALMYFLPYFIPVYYSLSNSNCCVLTWLHASLETGTVVWYFYLFKNFSQYIMTLTVKGLPWWLR